MANYHPDWQIEAQFLTLDLHRVMDLDSTANSHPIVQEVNHPDQITEIFDTISYSKGASVLRMLEEFLGREQFRQGVSLFLARFQYSNAVTADLWAAMEEVSDGSLDIPGIMNTWTRQMGYPVLQVTRIGPSSYRVEQERYLRDGSLEGEGTASPYGYRWLCLYSLSADINLGILQDKIFKAKIKPNIKLGEFRAAHLTNNIELLPKSVRPQIYVISNMYAVCVMLFRQGMSTTSAIFSIYSLSMASTMSLMFKMCLRIVKDVFKMCPLCPNHLQVGYPCDMDLLPISKHHPTQMAGQEGFHDRGIITTITTSTKQLHHPQIELSANRLVQTMPAYWVKFNVGQFGYYRVNYPAEDWSALTTLLAREPSALGHMDRASLLNDAFSLAESGHISYTVPLDMTRNLEQEVHLVPWATIYDKLVAMGSLLELSPTFPLFREYVVDLVHKNYERLGWQDKGTHIERINR